MFLNKCFPHAKRTVFADQPQSNSFTYIGRGGQNPLRSFLCLNAFPAFLTAIDCVVTGLFIVQRKEKAPLDAGKLSWERIEGSVAAIQPNNLELIELKGAPASVKLLGVIRAQSCFSLPALPGLPSGRVMCRTLLGANNLSISIL